MKKILMLFLLIFPLFIFALVNIAATVISYYLTLPVESVETIEGAYIHTTTLNETNQFSFIIIPTEARNLSFNVFNEEDELLITYDGENAPVINPLGDNAIITVTINDETGFLNNGVFSFDITTKNFGLTQLTVVTEDGRYEARSDIFVQSPSSDPTEIQGIVFDYQARHDDFKFGTSNEVLVYYTYFPKSAYMVKDKALSDQINESLSNNAALIKFNTTNNLKVLSNEVLSHGRGLLTIQLEDEGFSLLSSDDLIKNDEFSFNGLSGYNIYNEEQLNTYSNNNILFMLQEINLTKWLTLTNVKLNGNGYKINHTKLPYYDQVDAKNNYIYNGRFAVEVVSNGTLENVHFMGPLNRNRVAYENISNLRLRANSNSNQEDAFNLNNITVENGRYNISVSGKSTAPNEPYRPTTFNLDNITLIGSSFAAIEVNSNQELAIMLNSTRLNLSNINISYTAIGILIQNSSGTRGYSEVNFISKNNEPSITSSSWRNLDDASGALNSSNFGYILQELKSYSDVIYQEGDDYYVNPILMVRGGRPNHSIVNFGSDQLLEDSLILKRRVPNPVEAIPEFIGGTAPFYVYLLDPIYHPDYMDEQVVE